MRVPDVRPVPPARSSAPDSPRVCRDVEQFVNASTQKPPVKPRKPRPLKSRAPEAVERVKVMIEQKDFDDAGPSDLVALYIVLHERVYSVLPDELLDGKEWMGAVSAATRLIRDIGDVDRALEFVRWCWLREKWKVDNRRESHSRMLWRFVFCSASLLTDYKVSLVREAHRFEARV